MAAINVYLRLSQHVLSERVTVPAECLIPTVRRQSDLDNRIQVTAESLVTRLLNLRGWITSTYRRAALARGVHRQWIADNYRLLPKDTSLWIDEVAEAPLSDKDPDKRFPDLSAVVTNIKTGPSGEPLACWYHIPPLAPRHRPELFVPRVCGARPTTFMNADSAVVDANFATLWRSMKPALSPFALLAVLNSAWVWANLEQNCTVLGGGALKVEATDLRRLALPSFDELALGSLTRLGKNLGTNDDDAVLAEIDWIIAEAITGSGKAEPLIRGLIALGNRGYQHRSRAASLRPSA